jgi:hypothetical protein
MENIVALKHEIQQKAQAIILEESKKIFDTYKELHSFGWYQEIQATKHGAYIYNETGMPNINGNIGELITPYIDIWDLQQKVGGFLKQFDPALLIMTFGDKNEVAIYNDNTLEITKYDNNRPTTYEL